MPRNEQFGTGNTAGADSADPFEVLGLSREAGVHDITDAYRRLAKERHPDITGHLGEEAMKHLNVARELAAGIANGDTGAVPTDKLAQAFADALGHLGRTHAMRYEEVRPVRLEDFGPGVFVQEVKRAA